MTITKVAELTIKAELISGKDSEYFQKVVTLGDSNSKTLGFLPRDAFEKYAGLRQIIIALDVEQELVGYLLYRTSYNSVKIVHLCVESGKRGSGIAETLVNFLKKQTKHYDGIKLKCRVDYGVDHVWESFNFVARDTVEGRGADRKPLTVWWYPHSRKDLLTDAYEYSKNQKLAAVIDSNIFYDLKNSRELESLCLLDDWLVEEVNLFITREVLNEINRSSSEVEKAESRAFANRFHRVAFDNESRYQEILEELRLEFDPQTTNDYSDIRHLAYCVSEGFNYFITRDREVLKRSSVMSRYSLSVMSPGQFISSLDESLQGSKYQPQKLVGTSIETVTVSTKEIDSVLDRFRKPNERKVSFEKKIDILLANKLSCELVSVIYRSEVVAIYGINLSKPHTLEVEILRLRFTSIRRTLAKHLLYELIQRACIDELEVIRLTDVGMDSDIREILEGMYFSQKGQFWEKKIINKIVPFGELNHFVARTNKSFLTETHPNRKYIIDIEKRYFPLKISETDIPTYIVPIKPHWAEHLFDDKSNEKLDLSQTDHNLLLNRENIYYRSATPRILKAPARLLWYVSHNPTTNQSGAIKACSYVDDVIIDKPKSLYRGYKNLGVYKFKHLLRTAGGDINQDIMAFVFSNTELFHTPISHHKMKEIYNTYKQKMFMPITPIEISNELFLYLYKIGKGLKDE